MTTIQSQLDQVLAPCPFCGDHDAELINGEDWDEGFSVSCQACWLTLGSFTTEGEAIAAWNSRAAVGGEAVCHRWLRNGEVTSKWTDGVPSARALESAKECSKNAATWVVQYAYASPTATVDVGVLRELVEKLSAIEQVARNSPRRDDMLYANGIKAAKDELAALIDGAGNG